MSGPAIDPEIERELLEFSPADRELIENVMRNRGVTAAQAIEGLLSGGGL
jgi:hypothetical protein